MKNGIIIVTGYCATGKSTFSRDLSKYLKIPCFNKDTIKENLGDGLGPENNMVYQKGSLATFLLMLHIAEQFLQTGKICILESNFKSIEIEKIKKLLEKYNSECLTYIFKGNYEILFNRYIERDKSGKRHWVHQTAGETMENFQKGHIKQGIGDIGIGQTIITDTTNFTDIDYEKLFLIGKEFINELVE